MRAAYSKSSYEKCAWNSTELHNAGMCQRVYPRDSILFGFFVYVIRDWYTPDAPKIRIIQKWAASPILDACLLCRLSIPVNMIFIVRNKVIIKAVSTRDGRKFRPFLWTAGILPGAGRRRPNYPPATIIKYAY